MTSIDVIGTCYSRELFNTTDRYIVNTYLMQQSIFTMFSQPLKVDLCNVRSHDNYNFKNRMLYYEFNKLGIEKLIENHSEYIIIDLFDNVRDIYQFANPENVKIVSTRDTEITLKYLQTKEKYNDISMQLISVIDYSDNELYEYLKRFTDKLLEIYEEENIILNIAQMQNVYYENNVKKYIDNNFVYDRRFFITKLEKIFVSLLPNCKILHTDFEPILDINHRFGGPHPVHFESIYYEYRMKVLDSIIRGENYLEQINDSYNNLYEQEIIKIKLKRIKN